MQTKKRIDTKEIDALMVSLGVKELDKNGQKFGDGIYTTINNYALTFGTRTAQDTYDRLADAVTGYNVPFLFLKDGDKEDTVLLQLACYEHPTTRIPREDIKDTKRLYEIIELLVHEAHKAFIDLGIKVPEINYRYQAREYYYTCMGGEYAMRLFLHNANVMDTDNTLVFH